MPQRNFRNLLLPSFMSTGCSNSTTTVLDDSEDKQNDAGHQQNSTCRSWITLVLYIVQHFIVPGILFVLFFAFFGLETLQKANDMDVQTVRRMTPSRSLRLPALTFCPMGWKETQTNVVSLRFDLCNGTDSIEDLAQCINSKAFSLNETVDPSSSHIHQHTEEGIQRKNINQSLWFSSLVVPVYGLCHTLTYPNSMAAHDFMVVTLRKNFRVFLHDPKFFVQRMDNFVVPFLSLDKPLGKNYRLIATTKRRMRRPGKFECNPDDGYNFQVHCIQHHMTTFTQLCDSAISCHRVIALYLCF